MTSIAKDYISSHGSTTSLFNATSGTISTNIEEIPADGAAVGEKRRKRSEDKEGSSDEEDVEEVCSEGTCARLDNVDWEKLLIPYFTMVVYGRRRIGKSVLVNHILSKIKDRFEDAYVFSQTSDVQPLMWSAFHKTRIHNRYSSSKLSEIFDDRKKLMEKVNDEFKEKRKKELGSMKMKPADEKFYKKLQEKHLKDTLILLDDIVGDQQIRTCSLFQNIFTLGRHYRLSLIILSQNANRRGALNRECTGNADYALTSSMLLKDDYQVLAEQYWGTEGGRRGAQFIAENTSEDYVFLFTDNTNKTKNRKLLTDHTFSYKSPSPEDTKRFFIGKEAWRLERLMEKEKNKKTGPLKLTDPAIMRMPQNNEAVTHFQIMENTMLPRNIQKLENGPLFTFRYNGPQMYYDE